MDDTAVETPSTAPQLKLSLSEQNYERIKAFQNKNPGHAQFFVYHDLRRYTKKGLIDCKKTVAAHKEYYERTVAHHDAKHGKPHECKTSDQILEDSKGVTTRQQSRYLGRQYAKNQKRQNKCCHAIVNNGTNHDQRHKMRSRLTAQNVNYYTRDMTAKRAISGPRCIRKNVIRLRLAQLAAQQAPPTVEIEPSDKQSDKVVEQ